MTSTREYRPCVASHEPTAAVAGFTAFALVILIGLGWVSPVLAADEGRPNVILFIADDMAWDDCGAYGHPHIRTPNVDRLAREGMRFDNAFLTCSSCSPSRASLITGRYPHSTGAPQLHQPLSGDQVTFVERLKDAGYYTAAAGKWHMGEETKPKFEHVETKMNRWVETLRDRPKDAPFFMWFAFSDPHRPYQEGAIPQPHTPDDAVVPPYLPDVPATREDLALYYDEIARLDGVVGDVMELLEEQGVADETMVLFLSDNGRPFPRCKTTVYDSGIKTPFIVRWPQRVEAGTTCASLVSSVDVAPTLLEMAGLPVTDSFQGKSFLPLLDDPTATTRQYVFAEHNWHDFDDYGRAVRSPRFKYICNEYTDVTGSPPADAVRSPTFQAMRELRDRGELTPAQQNPFVVPRPREELYDCVADPDELTNLAEEGQYAEEFKLLRAVLQNWKRETLDQVPEERRADEFDRETGERLPEFRKRRR